MDLTTQPTDSNIFSAYRTLQEIQKVLSGYDDHYLSKRNDDEADGKNYF